MLKLTAALRRRWPLMAVLGAIGLIVGVVSGLLASDPVEGPQRWRATQVIITAKTSGQSIVPQDALKVVRGRVADRAAELTGAAHAAEAVDGVDATYDQQEASISVTCVRGTADVAVDCAQAFVDAFLEVSADDSQRDERLQLAEIIEARDVALLERGALLAQHPQILDPDAEVSPAVRQELGDLDSRISNAESEIRQRELQLVRSAPYESLGVEAPSKVSSSTGFAIPASPVVRGGVLGAVGLIGGALVAFVIERAFPRIDSREDLLAVSDLPILTEVGWVPSKRQPTAEGMLSLEGMWAEPYRRLRAAVRFAQTAAGDAGDPVPKVFMVTSATPAEGKSTTCALLGLALAEQEPTVVVDGDFRRPSVGKLLGDPRGATLEDLVEGAGDKRDASRVVLPTEKERLYVVRGGRPIRDTVTRTVAAKSVLRASSSVSTVVVDTSPLQVSSDALDLLDSVDRTIVVVRSGSITTKQFDETVDVLTRMGTPILGVVLVAAAGRTREQQYYYDYYAHR